ncbi:MAG: hypothetical protein JWM80_4958 [Cyanobacteria bacterium RYN_339]|nr:hypothetical protein [Cyanobacteria bacterium RYN_339]
MKFTMRLSSLVLLAALAGCGTSPALTAARATTGTPTVQEAVPSDTELKALEAASPDELIENAPTEPGMAKGIWPHPPAEDLGNFGKVNDTLFRGARPTDKGLEQLQAMGVRTIVNFENDKQAVAHEAAWCMAHGIAFHAIPLSVITPPKQAKVDEWLKFADDTSVQPLYFHCMQGRDRTGTAALTYRIRHDKWTFDKAYSEMKAYHFHTYLLGLQFYIRHFK